MTRALLRLAVALAIAMVLAPAGPALADTDVDISAKVRSRYEADDRSLMEDVDVDHLLTQQTRVRMDLKHGDGAEAVVEVQDSRVWGDEGSVSGDTENLDLHQGFLRFHPWDVATAQLGRQELSYGRERVLGDGDFYNVGQSFDALKLHVDLSEHWLDFVFGKVSEETATGVDENMFATFLHLDLEANDLMLEPFVLYKEDSGNSRFLTALGTYAKWHSDRWWIKGDGVYETGHQSGESVHAYLLALDLAADVSRDADRSSGAAVGFAMYSGDDPAADDDIAYDHLYADNHGYFGIMDLVQPTIDAAGVGLTDFHGRIWFQLAEGVQLVLGGSVFKADVDTDLGSGRDGKDVGKEVDVVVSGRLAEGVMLEAGGGYLQSGDLLEATIDEENAGWGYLQATGSF